MLESMLPMSSFIVFELLNGADARKVWKRSREATVQIVEKGFYKSGNKSWLKRIRLWLKRILYREFTLAKTYFQILKK